MLQEFSVYTLRATFQNIFGVVGYSEVNLETTSDRGPQTQILKSDTLNFYTYKVNEINAQITYLQCPNGFVTQVSKSLVVEWWERVTGNDSTNFTMVVQTTTSPSDLITNYTIPEFMKLINTTYDLEVRVYAAEQSSNKAIFRVKYTVLYSNLLVYIQGGNRMQAFNKFTVLNAFAKDLDVIPSQQQRGIESSWHCINLNTNENCTDIQKQPIELVQNVSTQTFAEQTFVPYNSYYFSYQAIKDVKQGVDFAVLVIVETDIPPCW